MNTTNISNPFLVSGYQSPALFCDRETETSNLLLNAQNGRNTTLLSLRRMGKTSLLHHTIHMLHSQQLGIGIFVDVFDTENLKDFTNKITSAVLNALPEKDPFWKKAMDFVKQLRPVISYDGLTGTPQISLDYSQNVQFEKSLEAVFQFLESQNKLILIAIDEFQQITQYPEKNMEAFLRTKIQQLKNVRFIFSGSSPHLLAEMFHHAKRPFFASTHTVELKEIDGETYASFIKTKFYAQNKQIAEDAIDYILDFTKLHTYYTQWLCNHLYATNQEELTLDVTKNVAFEILMQNESVYFQYRTLLTANQWNMLRAIAKEGKMRNPNSKEIQAKYRLGGSSVVYRSIDALLQKEMVYTKEDEIGKFYCVYDCFLARWLELK